MENDNDTFELIDFINVIWKRKWLVVVPTFLLVLAAVVISLKLPKIWEVDAVILPRKFFIQTEAGQFNEIQASDPREIAVQINQKTYNAAIAEKLNLDIRSIPDIKAENLPNTNLVRVSARDADVEKTKAVLLSLYGFLKADLEEKINVDVSAMDQQIKSISADIRLKNYEIETQQNNIADLKLTAASESNKIQLKKNSIKVKNLNIESEELKKARIQEEIDSFLSMIAISEERSNAIAEEMKGIKERIDQIEREQQAALKQENSANAMSILLYSIGIQNYLLNYNALNEKLNEEKITQVNLNLDIERKREELKKTDNIIEQFKTQIEDIQTGINDIETNIKKIGNEIEAAQAGISFSENEVEILNSEDTLLEENKVGISYTDLIKNPSASLEPVAPKKKAIVLVTGMLSLLFFGMLAFFLEYLKTHKSRG